MDPLANLNDIHLPEQIHNYPVALGWWLLLVALLLILIVSTIAIYKRRKRTKAKNIAIKRLMSSNSNNSVTLSTIKWAAMQYFPREDVANLYEESLYQFMLNSLAKKYHAEFEQLTSQAFTEVYQQSTADAQQQQLKDGALLWLKYALPPKKQPHSSQSTTTSQSLAGAEQ